MGLVHDGVIFLNFDQSYVPQRKLRQWPHVWLDLHDIRQTNRYCEKASLLEIERRLRSRRKSGVTFIGSGNYHYVTYLLLRKITQPFTLILFDHHTDMIQEPSSFPISCGSWVTEALMELSALQKAIIVGAQPDSLPSLPPRLATKVTLYPKDDVRKLDSRALANRLLADIATANIYISIDKDVLDESEAVTNWDQGSMKLDALVRVLHRLILAKNVLGIDICGEWPASPVDFFSPSCRAAIAKNETSNQKILQTVFPLALSS
ncbi:arginase family protein [Bacillaceae bacterium]